jgi:oxygen-dependent protoporphyrinogen oxidase
MLGALDSESRAVTIVGAGFAGLTSALALAKKGYRVRVCEREDRPGGMLVTEQVGEFTVEHAANSLVVSPAMYRLCTDVGVRLHTAAPGHRTKYIMRNREARQFPPLSYLELLEASAKFVRNYWALDDLNATLGSWIEMHFGARVLEYVVAPGITGVFACSPFELSMRALFRDYGTDATRRLIGCLLTQGIQRMLLSWRSEAGSYGAIVDGGMQALMDAIYRKLRTYPNVEIQLGVECYELPKSGNICLCVPAYKAADLIATECAVSAQMLRAVAYSPLISASVVIPKKYIRELPSGTGILFPPKEQRGVLGILFSSRTYPQIGGCDKDHVLLRAFLGGTQNSRLVQASEDEIRMTVSQEFDALWGFQDRGECEWRIRYWHRAIPIYSHSLYETWKSLPWIQSKGRLLFASYTGRVSLRGMAESAESI